MANVPIYGRKGFRCFTQVSDEDFELVSKYHWYLKLNSESPHIKYAYTWVEGETKKKDLYLHRLIMGDKEGYYVDHINRDSLDNRRENLRHVTPSESTINRTVPQHYKYSSRLGTTRKGTKWQSQAKLFGKIYYFGLFDTKEDAQKAFLVKMEEIRQCLYKNKLLKE